MGGLQKGAQERKEAVSVHPPYREKRCDDCHDKKGGSGLAKPLDRLCCGCHPALMKGRFVHGPAAVGECLNCHEPHQAEQSALLKVEKGQLCLTCHKEKRVAEAMHNKLAAAGLVCTECHNPHGSDARYFLK